MDHEFHSLGRGRHRHYNHALRFFLKTDRIKWPDGFTVGLVYRGLLKIASQVNYISV